MGPTERNDHNGSQDAATSQRDLSPGLGATSYWVPPFEQNVAHDRYPRAVRE